MPVAGAIIGGVAAIGGGLMAASATKKAAKSAAATQDKATAAELEIAKNQEQLFRDIHKDNQINFQPYLTSGYGAQAVAQQLLGLKPMTADQFNRGEWYVPGSVDYRTPPAPATPTTGTPTTGTPTTGTPTAPQGPTPADEDAWASRALAALSREVNQSIWSQVNSIQDPSDRLAALQPKMFTQDRNVYNQFLQSNPRPTAPTSAPGGGTIPLPTPPSTQFPSTPAYGPVIPPPTSATASTTNPDAQAQAAIAAGANPLAIAARLAASRFGDTR